MIQKVLQPLYFAREDTRSPFRYALVAMVVNAVLAIGLAPVIGYLAAAWGTTLSAWGMVILLWRGSRGMGQEAELDARFWQRIGRIVLASVLMGGLLYAASLALTGWLEANTIRYAALAALVGLGLISYGVIGQLIGAFRLSDMKAELRRSN